MPRILLILALIAAVIAAPLLLQREDIVRPDAAEAPTLVIITPHNESIRREFELAFRAWHRRHFGSDVRFDWRVPGGTSEITRQLDSDFSLAQAHNEAQTDSRRLPPEQVGIGIDVFFGGGAFDFDGQAAKGQFQPLRVFAEHPEWFSGEAPVLPQWVGGELWYDQDHRWIGACLSSFGIIYNRDSLARLGLPEPDQWSDLTDPRYFGQIALADPSKSGSAMKAFEMVLQQQMQRHPEDPEAGFSAGFALLRRIAGNTRYFTDSSSKIPLDVSQGNAAAGMCIDFYARNLMEQHPDRVGFISPAGGSSTGSDPIAVLRGAPQAELAQRFVSFVISPVGQRLWNQRLGTPGGPQITALRRLPLRRDLYTANDEALRSDPGINPFANANSFHYDSALTGALFNELRLAIRLSCLDLHPELKAAWERVSLLPPDSPAARAFDDPTPLNLPFLTQQLKPARKNPDPLVLNRLEREILMTLRQRYQTLADTDPAR